MRRLYLVLGYSLAIVVTHTKSNLSGGVTILCCLAVPARSRERPYFAVRRKCPGTPTPDVEYRNAENLHPHSLTRDLPVLSVFRRI